MKNRNNKKAKSRLRTPTAPKQLQGKLCAFIFGANPYLPINEPFLVEGTLFE